MAATPTHLIAANSLEAKELAEFACLDDASNHAVCEGLYRIGSLMAYGDGAAEYSDVERFVEITHDKDGNPANACVYIPTTDYIEEKLGFSKYVESYQTALKLNPQTKPECHLDLDDHWIYGSFNNKGLRSGRMRSGSFVQIVLYYGYLGKQKATDQETFEILGNLAAYFQARSITGVALIHEGFDPDISFYERLWLSLLSANKKARPGVCRNCGLLYSRYNSKGNIVKSCSSICTTEYNNEVKRLNRIHSKDSIPLKSDIYSIARRTHEKRPLQLPGKPEKAEESVLVRVESNRAIVQHD